MDCSVAVRVETRKQLCYDVSRDEDIDMSRITYILLLRRGWIEMGQLTRERLQMKNEWKLRIRIQICYL